MRSTKSIVLSLALPVLVALAYGAVFFTPRPEVQAPSTQMSGEESGELWKQCRSLVRDGKYREALPGVLKLHEAYPNNHIYIEMAAEIYDQLGDYPQEAEFWEKYFDRAPNPITGCPQLGQVYWKLGDRPQAVAAYERCLALQPDNSDSIFFLAHALEMTGKTQRAGELYERGAKLAPEYTDIVVGLARVRLRQGNSAQAEAIILPVLKKAPENADALLVAGLLYGRKGDLSRAREYLERGVKISDSYLDFHLALADIAEQQKNYAEAIRQYDRILRDHPDDREILAKRNALMGRQ
jgi:tetratricopeptide (TPR) repeat protein